MNIFFLFFFLFSYGLTEFYLSNEFVTSNNIISGPAADNSIFSKGSYYLNTLNFGLFDKIGSFDYGFNFSLLFTDDIKNDTKNVSLKNLRLNFGNKINNLYIGDVFEGFSQYNFLGSIKGLSYKFNYSEKIPEVKVIFGYYYPRWENLWEKEDVFKRKVYGLGLKYKISDLLNFELSGVNSLDENKLETFTTTNYDNYVYALNLEYTPLVGLTFRTETAYSYTVDISSLSNTNEKFIGYVLKLEAIGNAEPSRLSLFYEITTPNFKSTFGSTTPDREKAKVSWRYRPSKIFSMNCGFLFYRNNLDKKSYTINVYKPDISFSFSNLFRRQYFNTTVSYNLELKDIEEAKQTIDHIADLSIRDRFFIFDNSFSFGYSKYDTSNSNEFKFRYALSFRKTLAELVFSPSLNLGYQKFEYFSINDTVDVFDNSFLLNLEIPSFGLTTSIRYSQSKTDRKISDDTQRLTLGFDLFYKLSFIKKIKSTVAFLRIISNDYKSSDVNSNLKETSINLGLNIEL